MNAMSNKKQLLLQYVIGLILNVLLLLVIASGSKSFSNMQLPEGKYQNNLWRGGDVLTYVNPARNFLENGVFGAGETPDYHRTTGYPFFLAAMIKIFGNGWLYPAIIIQALFFALIYPALSSICIIFTPGKPKLANYVFIFSLFSGAYWAFVPVILSDLFFTVLFVLGFGFGLHSITRQSYKYLVLHMAFLGFAAQIRPTLSLYFIGSFFLLFSLAKIYRVYNKKTITIITISTITLTILGNAPAVRNYVNHRFFAPTDIGYELLISYFGRDILEKTSKLNQYKAIKEEIAAEADLNPKAALYKKYAIEIIKDNPLMSCLIYCKNAASIMFNSHYNTLAAFWGYSYKNIENPQHYRLKKSNVILIIALLGAVVYAVIYFFAGLQLIRFIKEKQPILALSLIFIFGLFLLPSFLSSGAGSRMRLPAEGLLVILGITEISRRVKKG